MSFDAMDWAWKPEGLNSHERLTLLNLSWRLNQQDGKCFPSLHRIAADTGISRRSAQYALKSLEEKGLIQRVARFISTGVKGRNSNGYIIPALSHIHSPYKKSGAGSATAAGAGASAADGGVAGAPASAGAAHEQGSNSGKEQGINTAGDTEEKQSQQQEGKPGPGEKQVRLEPKNNFTLPPGPPPATREEVLAILNGD